MPKRNHSKLLHWLKTSVWAFPVVLALIFIVLAAFKISGTSVGIYHKTLYGAQSEDPDLLYGRPKTIRSDEWLSGTQIIISQSKNGFPRFNKDLGSGRDVSLLAEAPSWDWPTIFKPQNWSFFALPLEQAFALKWWFLMYLLVVSCYFFVLRILTDEKWFAILFSLAIGLSPFLLWWYQTAGFLSLAYGLLAIILSLRIINNEPVRFLRNKKLSSLLQVMALTFVIICFGLIFYPPFQIPVAIGATFFILGYLLQKRSDGKITWRQLGKRAAALLTSVLIAAVIGLLFIGTHSAPLEAQTGSVYPGKRLTEGGNLKLLNVFDSFVMPLEQSTKRAGHFITNQSEASNFILLLPFLLLPAVFLMARQWRKNRRVDFIYLSLLIVSALLFIRVFTPYGDALFKLLLLHRVPNERMIIGFGFIGLIFMVYTLKKIQEAKISFRNLLPLASGYSLLCFGVLLAIGVYITRHYPLFVHNILIVAILAAGFAALIGLLLLNRRLLFALAFLGFTVFSSFWIMPLYRGLGELTDTKVLSRIRAISTPQDSWATIGEDAIYYENFALLADRKSLSGTQIYPDNAFWERFVGQQYEDVYNRQAHVFFSDSGNFQEPVRVGAARNALLVNFNCSQGLKDELDFVLSVHPLDETCAKLIETVRYPQAAFYLYQIVE
ncbi:MAG: hypothetical protein WDZ34_02310 [Candidatus Saccharimonadales bacterium]